MSNSENARLKFYCDEHRCINCDGCSVACAEAHELPAGINRRKVITMNEGIEGLEYSLSIACMHCN
ncbi:MAG: formate dehydrogenase, partial [Halarcobacter sp.]